jgi:glucose/mannose-6-phosphate isomerase
VNRHYTLPAFVGPRTLVVLSSYSGNTEETLAAHREALRRRAPTLCITSGGTTARLAARSKAPLITVPGGLPPRAALGYSFFPLLTALSRWGLVRSRPRDVRETIALLESKAEEYGDPGAAANRALQLAEMLRGRLGVVYSSTERFDAVATRWRGQIAENAKSLMFGHVLPEMNHNELVGWKALTEPMSRMQVLFLRDRADHRRVQVRMEITKEIVARYAGGVAEVWSEGKSLLARIFSLVHLGDWVSLYLAVLHREDPMPVEVIDYLKRELAGVKR